MRTSEVLNRSADLLQERGWRTGPSGWETNSTSGLCVEGAIAAAMGIPVLSGIPNLEVQRCPAAIAVENYLAYGDRYSFLWSWNDAQDSGDRVIEVLRATALIEAAKEDSNIKEEVSA